MSISLDGPEPVHDAIRRRKGSYARAVDGIRLISGMPNAPRVSVYCTITERNVGSLQEFLDGLRDLRLHRVGLIHNNFITEELAASHNRLHAGMLRATPSNVSDADPTKIDIEALSSRLSAITTGRHPFPVVIQPHPDDDRGAGNLLSAAGTVRRPPLQ